MDWKATQQRLDIPADGIPGKGTFTALFAHQAARPADETLRSIGSVAAVILPLFGWTQSPERLAEFLAQTAHESGAYTRFAENMNYSAKRLMQVWPSRFPTLTVAQQYAGQPEKLANFVYGDRMGNKPGTDDGWNHRGGGMLQHTGSAEYLRLRDRLGYLPDDVRDPAKSVLAACDYMARASTQRFIDAGDFRGARRSINGGYIGVDDVAARRARSLRVLAG
jgi:putative chitinase